MAIRFQPPAITVNLVLVIFFAVMYYLKYRYKFLLSCEPFFKKAFLWMLISLITSIGVALLNGDTSAFTMGIRIIFSQYIFVFVFWHVCNTRKDLIYFSKCILGVFTIVFAYGLFEYMTDSNPFLDMIRANIPDAYADDKLYISDLEYKLRGGRARLQSLFYITILYGINSILFVFYIITVFKKQKDFKIKKFYLWIMVLLGLFACYLSNSKTPIVAIPLFAFPYFFKNKYSLLVWISLAVFILDPEIFNQIIGQVIDLESLDINNDDVSSGSTFAMRLRQLDVSFNAFLKSPFFGNGLKYSGYLASTIAGADLLGAESCWFKLLIEQGLLGISAYIYIMYTFIKEGAKISKNDKCSLSFFALAFFVIVSITDIGYELFYILFIALYKIYSFNNSNINYDKTVSYSNITK